MSRLYYCTSEPNLVNILKNQMFDSSVNAHLCCTTKQECDYGNINIPNRVGIVELDLQVIAFVPINRAQWSAGGLDPSVYYIVSGDATGIKYLVPCAEATSMFQKNKISSIVIEKTTPHDKFMNCNLIPAYVIYLVRASLVIDRSLYGTGCYP